MNHYDEPEPEHVMWQGRYITAKTKGRWEYVSRSRGIRAAVILAVEDGPGGKEALLVEQYRVPLGKPCIELPAGLIGDDDGQDGEDALIAAGRELEEETGYRASHLEDLGEFFSSPGMISESFHLIRARGLAKVGDGGGVGDENIVTHRVALADLPAFVAEQRRAGKAIDVRLLILMAGELLG